MLIDERIVNDIHRAVIYILRFWFSLLLCTCLALSPNLSTLSVSPTYWIVGDTHRSITIFASPPACINNP